MYLASAEFGKLCECAAAVVVVLAEDGECHEHLVGVEAGVVASEVFDFRLLYGLNHLLGYEFHAVVDACQVLGGIEQQCGAGAEQGAGFGGDEGAVGEFDGGGVHSAAGLAVLGGDGATAVVGGDAGLLEEQGNLVHLVLVAVALGEAVEGFVVAAYDFLLRGFAAGFVVADAESHHVHTHVGGRLVGVVAVDAGEECVEDGEDFDVAVVVDGHLVVGFHVEGVDHVHVVEVGGGSLIGDVHRMLQREVPYGESLELGVSGLHATLVFVVELAEAYGHLAAAGARGCDDDEGPGGLHIVVAAETLVGVDERNVRGIALDGIVVVGLDAQAFQLLAVEVGGVLTVVVGDDDGADEEAAVLEFRAQAQHVLIVGDAQVAAHLVLLDVDGRDDDDNLRGVGQLLQHAQLRVGLESREHTACVVVVEELSAQFEIELSGEFGNTFLDVLRLYAAVLLVVKTYFHNLIACLFLGFGVMSFSAFPGKTARSPGKKLTAKVRHSDDTHRSGEKFSALSRTFFKKFTLFRHAG